MVNHSAGWVRQNDSRVKEAKVNQYYSSRSTCIAVCRLGFCRSLLRLPLLLSLVRHSREWEGHVKAVVDACMSGPARQPFLRIFE